MMTGAHLGGRGGDRRRGAAAIAAPCGVGGPRGRGDGRNRPRAQRSFFLLNKSRSSSRGE